MKNTAKNSGNTAAMDEFDMQARINVLEKALSERGVSVDGVSNAQSPMTIRPTPYVFCSPELIPPRKFEYAQHYIRKFISATFAPGATGKSQLALTEALAMVTGRSLLHYEVSRPLNVWYFCGEDPREEIERRIAGIMKHYRIKPTDIIGNLYIDSGREVPITIAKTEGGKTQIATPVVDALVLSINELSIDALIIDPFVKSHRVTENDNLAVDIAALGWATVADKGDACVELIHHVRKMSGGTVTVDDGRGAGALKDASRSVRVLNRMSSEDAGRMGVTDNPSYYFRVDYGEKANLRAPGDDSDWHRFVSTRLGNAADGYDEDSIGVPTAWEPKGVFDSFSREQLTAVLSELSARPYRANSRASDWAGKVLGRILKFEIGSPGGKRPPGYHIAKKMLADWELNGVLSIEELKIEGGTDRNKHPVYKVVAYV